MKKALYIVPVLLLSLPGLCQEIVLDKKVNEQYDETFGPNLRHYLHSYTGLGFFTGSGEAADADIREGGSVDFVSGSRYKLKILSFYAIGADVSYRYLRYRITGPASTVAGDPFASAAAADKFFIGISSIGFELYNRINFGRRGNITGNFIDIGYRFQWNYAVREKLKSVEDNEKRKEVRKGINYIEDFTPVITIRAGFNKLVFFGNYNLSGLFDEELGYPGLPPLSIGIQLSY